jgi:hypothetical protein
MKKTAITFAAAIVALGLGRPGFTQNLTKDVATLDFNTTAGQAPMQLNGSAGFVDVDGKQRLRLTDSTGQVASAFISTPVQISDYLASFDFEVRSVPGGTADGFTFLAQTAAADAIGGGGGAIGLTQGDVVTPQGDSGPFPGYSYAIEFNSYAEQGLPSSTQTVALDLFAIRSKINQTAFRHWKKGVIHAEVRVTPAQLTLTVSGGTDNLPPTVILTSPSWLVDFFKAPAPLYLGFTAGTGGSGQIVDILNLKIAAAP